MTDCDKCMWKDAEEKAQEACADERRRNISQGVDLDIARSEAVFWKCLVEWWKTMASRPKCKME